MLPSLSKYLLTHQHNTESQGLVLGSGTVAGARIAKNKSACHILEYVEYSLDEGIFIGAPTQKKADAVSSALISIRGSQAGQYMPLHVSLPDAALRMDVLEFDSIPKSNKEQVELVNWRMQTEGGGLDGAYASQYLGCDDGRHVFLALSADKEWFEIVGSALRSAEVFAWSISADILRQFNRYHDRLIRTGGALININQESWALVLWDAAGRIRYARSGWRSESGEYADIAYDIERAIIAYVHGGAYRSIEHIYLVTGPQDEIFTEVLNSRLSNQCTKLDPLDGMSGQQMVSMQHIFLSGALAAAMEI